MKFCIFFVLIVPILIFAKETDTIFANHLSNELRQELNYYNIIFKTGKKTKSAFFLGLDTETVLKTLRLKNCKKIEFYSNDSLCIVLSNTKDTNFIWLLEKRKYEFKDTLRFSESKKTKKIDHQNVYSGYKYINPIKIIIKKENFWTNVDNPKYYILLYSNKCFLFVLENITKIVIHR
ncbi:MAG: hypothetical protein N2560_10400 [Ignavibacteria bacterium]|nr:hypothetical protein [Ignavibacteria bacterium]